MVFLWIITDYNPYFYQSFAKRKGRLNQYGQYGNYDEFEAYGSGNGLGGGCDDDGCEDEIVPRGYTEVVCFKVISSLKLGPIPIRRGEVAETIYDWGLTKTVAFDFKITKRSRGKKMIAVLSDLGGYRCCSFRNALFSVSLGSQTLSWPW